MVTEQVKFQSIKVNYPKKLYLLGLWATQESSDDSCPIFSNKLLKSIRSLKKESRKYIEHSKNETTFYKDSVLVVPLKYLKN